MKHAMITILLALPLAPWKPMDCRAALSERAPAPWIAEARRVHAHFTGRRGSVGQYGDSITYSKAFFSALFWGEYRAAEGLEEFRKRVPGECAEWKGPDHACYGGWRAADGLNAVEGALKRQNPEIALVMFGTNDVGDGPPEATGYPGKMRQLLRRVKENGTVPILWTIPPRSGHEERVRQYSAEIRRLAQELAILLVDYHAAIIARRREDWLGTLIDADGVHPSFPERYRTDFSEEGLKNSGYTLRNYMALKACREVWQAIDAPHEGAGSAAGREPLWIRRSMTAPATASAPRT